ncbi:MAG TPA: ABC transporter ATP-binding protein [Eubacteriales bacterium]|nr:ABC transporter ATP-binding protein [Eubacteriales bacterium]
MKQILPFLKPYKNRLILDGALFFIITVCSLLMPYLMSDIVNVGIKNGDMPYILRQGALMLALSAAMLVSGLATTKINSKIASGFSADLQRGVFQKINSLTFEEYESIGTSSLITRSTDDIFTLQEVSFNFVYALVTVPVLFFGGAALAFSSDWLLALVLVVLAPLVLLIVWLVTRNIGPLWVNADKYIDLQNKIVRERLGGIRVIRSFDKERFEHERAADATREMATNIIRSNVLTNMINPLSMLLLNLSTVAMLYIGAIRLQVEPLLSAGDVIATIQYVALIMNGLLVLSWTIAFMPHLKVCVRRIAEVLSLKGVEAQTSEKIRLGGEIELQDVSFRYENAEAAALSHIDMRIPSGAVAAIIGGTGSGKSTVAKLLLRFHAPTEGEIRLGGRDFETLTRETVRNGISIALQKPSIFQGTIAENLRMGNPAATDDELAYACRIAQIYDFVLSHEEGFDYKLSQAGANLSGGQKQRISIARAILKDAAVYVFDDSFSALDYLTESKLRRELNAYLRGKTQLIVTQRAASAMRCDIIYVLDRGCVVGSGTHAELMEHCPIYREIYVSQLGEPSPENGGAQ